VEGTSTPRRLSGDIVRYAAPELLENISAHATTSSDVCSFAMLVLECITEEIPFSNLSRDAVVVHARVSRRESPPRPDGQSTKGQVSDGLWDLMTRCWAYQPDRRPAMEDVHGFFQLQHPISDFVTPRGSSSRGYTIDSMGTNNQVSGNFLRKVRISITRQTRLGDIPFRLSRSPVRRDNCTDLERIHIEGVSFSSPDSAGDVASTRIISWMPVTAIGRQTWS